MHWTCIHLMKTKDETLGMYKAFTSWAKTQHNTIIKCLWSDWGGEYTGHKFEEYLWDQDTEHWLTTHNTPQHNGVAESLNRWLLEHICAMIHESWLPKFLGGEAISHAVWLKNWTSTHVIGHTTPFKQLYCLKPNLAGVPEWGQAVWYTAILATNWICMQRMLTGLAMTRIALMHTEYIGPVTESSQLNKTSSSLIWQLLYKYQTQSLHHLLYQHHLYQLWFSYHLLHHPSYCPPCLFQHQLQHHQHHHQHN